MNITNNYTGHTFDYDPLKHTIIIGENGSGKTTFLDWVTYGELNRITFEDYLQDIDFYEWFKINNPVKNNKEIEIVNNIIEDDFIFDYNYEDLFDLVVLTNDKYHICDLLKNKYNIDLNEMKINQFSQGQINIIKSFAELIVFLEEYYRLNGQYIKTIDYIEDHLSLKYQQNILSDLIDFVKDYNIKLLVTTHSPEIYNIVNHPAYDVDAINFSE